MAYYRTCSHCGAHLDPGEVCNCIESIRDRVIDEVMSLTDEECKILLDSWKISEQHPELTPEECVERAAQGATNTQDGKAEQIDKPVSVSIVTEHNG